jgi:DNA-binding protein HU-beta
MKKDEIVQAVADAAGIEKAAANRALDAVVDVITSSVASGQKIQIPGLGTFEPRERNAREGRNPQTGETIQIAATTTPGFKAATAFKNAVAGS